MMRIGYLTYGLDRQPTGIGRYSLELVKALAALPGAPEIVLLTTEDSDRHGLWSKFEHHKLAGCRRLPELLTRGNWEVSAAIKRYGLDVVHDPNGIAPFLGKAHGAARLVTIHDALPYVYPATHNRLDNLRYRWMLPTAAKRADKVLTDSECSRRDIVWSLKLPADKVQTVLIAASPDFAPVPDSAARQAVLDRYAIKPPYLLYVGGLNARKNLARLLEAFSQLQSRFQDLRLVINGPRQWQLGELNAALTRLDVADRIDFTGYVADADLPALYSAATAFVFPSLYEGFGLPPLEAMQCGTPVVTSNASSLPEVVGEAALTVDPYDVNGLAKAIERVLTDESLRTELRKRGYAQATRFSWFKTASETLAAYEQALENRKGGRYAVSRA